MEKVREPESRPSHEGEVTRISDTRRQVLLIEDDPQIGQLVAIELKEIGHDVELITDGREGLSRFEDGNFDLVVLDLMLPGLDGLEICQRIRANCRFTPIVMVTARASKGDIVRGLELGADEYVTKPFTTPELMARIQALLRRIEAYRDSGSNSASIVRQGALVIDPRKHDVQINEEPVSMTAKEFDLLHLFARHPGRTFSRSELLNVIWGIEFEGYEHTVNTHINRLRKKLGLKRQGVNLIETVWGVGYRFREPQP